MLSLLVAAAIIATPADIVGYWIQTEVDCAAAGVPSQPLRELLIKPDASFTATFVPFEHRYDHWGTVAFNPETGGVFFTITGGNEAVQGLILSGTADVVDGHLVLDGVYFGHLADGAAEDGCRYTFQKYR
ncbi:MAG: hypothetical protein ACOH1E_10950 [Brevundimonas sp.]